MNKLIYQLIAVVVFVTTNLMATDSPGEHSPYLQSPAGYNIQSLNRNRLTSETLQNLEPIQQDDLFQSIDLYMQAFNKLIERENTIRPSDHLSLQIFGLIKETIYVSGIIAVQHDKTSNISYYHIPDLRPESENNCCIS